VELTTLFLLLFINFDIQNQEKFKMVAPFTFARLPQIIFGHRRISDLPAITGKFGRSVLLVSGAKSFAALDIAKELFEQFDRKDIKIYKVTVPGEPSPELVDEVVRRFANTSIDVVVSIGGGSVMDAGKAISAMLYRTESVKEFLEVVGDREHPGTKIPFIAIPTTAGTGSEATKNAVLSEVGSHGFKRSLRHDNFVPDVALVDPELTTGCPPEITAASGMDCFTQLTEAYLSTKSNEYTDALALAGIKAVKESLRRAYANGDDIEARSGMAFAALSSGICLANAGLGTVHGIAGTTGAMFNIPHGVVCGTLMASANEVTVRELRNSQKETVALRKYSTLGKIVSGKERGTEEYFQDAFIQYLHDLTVSLELPRLGQYGLTRDDIIAVSSAIDNKNNPVKFNEEQLLEIMEKRL
jgi:alcohol dehydrogenase class IV